MPLAVTGGGLSQVGSNLVGVALEQTGFITVEPALSRFRVGRIKQVGAWCRCSVA
jgi:hypothetical protein